MARGSGSTAHRLHTVVTEAIDAVADPTEARAILAEALTSAGLPALPSEPETLGLFVSLWLHGSLSRRLGDVTADLVDAELTRVLEGTFVGEKERDTYATGVRERRPWPENDVSESARPTIPSPPDDSHRTPVAAPLARRRVIVATSDERAAIDFGRLEDAATEVTIVANAHELSVAMSSVGDRVGILVLDGARPTVPAVMLATSSLGLAPETRVVLFRYDASLIETLRAFAPMTKRWQSIGRGARAVDVIACAAIAS